MSAPPRLVGGVLMKPIDPNGVVRHQTSHQIEATVLIRPPALEEIAVEAQEEHEQSGFWPAQPGEVRELLRAHSMASVEGMARAGDHSRAFPQEAQSIELSPLLDFDPPLAGHGPSGSGGACGAPP